MIAGSWQAVFVNTSGPYPGGFTLVCSLSVSSTGVVNNSLCNAGSYFQGTMAVIQTTANAFQKAPARTNNSHTFVVRLTES